jgi:hypothetical protein
MSEKRPNVFPSSNDDKEVNNQIQQPNVRIDSDYESQKLEMAQEVYSNSINETGMAAVEAMRKRTEEQIRLRDEMLRKNQEQTQSYQDKMTEANERRVYGDPAQQQLRQQSYQTEEQFQKPVYKEIKSPISEVKLDSVNQVDHYIQQLSQPQFNTAFDVLPLPSEGKLYKNKKPTVKVAYLTAADENILTSPNLLQSGEFLEILINRKLLETDLRYKDLHIGDRNAIMLWLRATSYGEMYPVTLLDENDIPFDTEINLNDLKTKHLNVEPDEEGLFNFQLPVSKAYIKFKLLNISDIDGIEKLLETERENNIPVNNTITYTLEKQIVEVNGDRNKANIKEFVQNMRIKDSKELRAYIESIDCGVDLKIKVGTPGGGSIETFLPLSVQFFWPDIQL